MEDWKNGHLACLSGSAEVLVPLYNLFPHAELLLVLSKAL
jgi:hypothetical protein